ncbi:MAG: DegT/DnrJ/EryC1/StrS family aminotransferase [Candidatus Glassbacteria bacterium]|nr:DegT/DnrJ/EryC1/StrS family aminotransferase [Candidatus Glassbacteria bacterium]
MAELAINGGRPVREDEFPRWPVWDESELEAAAGVINSGEWGMAGGDRVLSLQEKFAAYQDAAHGVATTSGTTALRTALIAAGLPAGAEVIVPAYTFVASVTAVLEANMIPVFADIDPDTYTLDPASVRETITGNTGAIMPVHIAGLPAEMDAIGRIADQHDLVVVEDACQAWGSEFRGRKVGAVGAMGTFSFQSSKHITAGEGGMIVTDDEELAERCTSLVDCGRTRGGAWHEHHLLGGNYRLSELQAAVILAQLERYGELLRRRQESAAFLRKALGEIDGIDPLLLPDYVTATSCHLFVIRYRPEAFGGLSKELFVRALNAEGIRPAHGGYFIPVYRQPVLLEKNVGPFDLVVRHSFRGKPLDYGEFDCPVSERACGEEAVWLLQNLLLAGAEGLEQIVEAVRKISRHHGELLN